MLLSKSVNSRTYLVRWIKMAHCKPKSMQSNPCEVIKSSRFFNNSHQIDVFSFSLFGCLIKTVLSRYLWCFWQVSYPFYCNTSLLGFDSFTIKIFISFSTVQKNIKVRVYPLSLETILLLCILSVILSGSARVASLGCITPDDDRKLL